MLSRRNSIRNRVSKKFARVPGEHGDAFVPAFYPVPIVPGWWGAPFGKVKGTAHVGFAIVGSLIMLYYVVTKGMFDHWRVFHPPRRAIPLSFALRYSDLDDPDYAIKYRELQREIAANELDVRWGGTNYLASYLWQPGDPEPDIRRKEPPAHH